MLLHFVELFHSSNNFSTSTGTSNWSADYFLSTGGIGIIFGPTKTESSGIGQTGNPDLRTHLANVFDRDWNSEYSHHP